MSIHLLQRMTAIADRRVQERELQQGRTITREERAAIYRKLWRDAGAAQMEAVRNAFLRATAAIDLDHVTCPKCWRHTFATLLQEANVDPHIRQITLGHAPTTAGQSALGTTGVYTHTCPALQHQEILRAVRLRPAVLALVVDRSQCHNS